MSRLIRFGHVSHRDAEGLIFCRCGFFFLSSFLTPNLWGRWTNLNKTWTHIHLWLLFEKFGPNSPVHLPPRGWGGKKLLFGINFLKFDQTSLQPNMISTIGKKLVYLQRLHYMPPNLVNFGPQTAENCWLIFAHLLNCHIGRHCQLYCMYVT